MTGVCCNLHLQSAIVMSKTNRKTAIYLVLKVLLPGYISWPQKDAELEIPSMPQAMISGAHIDWSQRVSAYTLILDKLTITSGLRKVRNERLEFSSNNTGRICIPHIEPNEYVCTGQVTCTLAYIWYLSVGPTTHLRHCPIDRCVQRLFWQIFCTVWRAHIFPSKLKNFLGHQMPRIRVVELNWQLSANLLLGRR